MKNFLSVTGTKSRFRDGIPASSPALNQRRLTEAYSGYSQERKLGYCIFAYSALACFRMGMSGSASFQG